MVFLWPVAVTCQWGHNSCRNLQRHDVHCHSFKDVCKMGRLLTDPVEWKPVVSYLFTLIFVALSHVLARILANCQPSSPPDLCSPIAVYLSRTFATGSEGFRTYLETKQMRSYMPFRIRQPSLQYGHCSIFEV